MYKKQTDYPSALLFSANSVRFFGFADLFYGFETIRSFAPSNKQKSLKTGFENFPTGRIVRKVAQKHIAPDHFAALLQRSKQKLYRVAYCYVKNEQDALDVIGDATYKGLQHLDSLREPAYFDTWMTRIVINTAIDHMRKNARCAVYEDEVLETLPAGQTVSEPEATLDLYAALDALSEKDRTCIILKYFEGYTFAEIAALTAEAEPTVKSRLYRSLTKMRKRMEKEGDSI